MTNGEIFEKVFGYDGTAVNKIIPSDAIEKIGTCGYKNYCSEGCGSRHFPRCPLWWKDDFAPAREDYNIFIIKR